MYITPNLIRDANESFLFSRISLRCAPALRGKTLSPHRRPVNGDKLWHLDEVLWDLGRGKPIVGEGRWWNKWWWKNCVLHQLVYIWFWVWEWRVWSCLHPTAATKGAWKWGQRLRFQRCMINIHHAFLDAIWCDERPTPSKPSSWFGRKTTVKLAKVKPFRSLFLRKIDHFTTPPNWMENQGSKIRSFASSFLANELF